LEEISVSRPSGSEHGEARHALSRRGFLAATAGALAAAACAPPYRPSDFAIAPLSPVGLFPVARYDGGLLDTIARGLRELRVDVAGRRVLLKPNLVEYEADTIINTHPLVVAAAAVAFRQAGAREVVVGEGPGHRRDIEYLLAATGLDDQLRSERIRFADLNHDDVEWVPARSRFTGLERLALPVELLRSDFVVSLPKLKTHHWAGLTCSMKNFFGVMPGAVYGWPKNLLHQRGIPQSIVDIVATVRPHFAIVDGVVGMEGDGPIMGTARPVGVVAMGADLVAVDATCARLMGLDPGKVPYLKTAARFLGNASPDRIEHRGEPLARYATRFELAPHTDSMRLE
jgi:uncharacterized protein (DUF362 family)